MPVLRLRALLKGSLPARARPAYETVERLFAEMSREYIDDRRLRELMALLRAEERGPV